MILRNPFAEPGQLLGVWPPGGIEQLLLDRAPVLDGEPAPREAVQAGVLVGVANEPAFSSVYVAQVGRFSHGGGEQNRAPDGDHGVEGLEQLRRDGHAVVEMPESGEAA